MNDQAVWSTRSDPPDPIFAAIDAHRATYTAMERAEDDYNADPEEKEEGPIAERLHEAGDHERQLFNNLLPPSRARLRGGSD
jgi:hypothetical protein